MFFICSLLLLLSCKISSYSNKIESKIDKRLIDYRNSVLSIVITGGHNPKQGIGIIWDLSEINNLKYEIIQMNEGNITSSKQFHTLSSIKIKDLIIDEIDSKFKYTDSIGLVNFHPNYYHIYYKQNNIKFDTTLNEVLIPNTKYQEKWRLIYFYCYSLVKSSNEFR